MIQFRPTIKEFQVLLFKTNNYIQNYVFALSKMVSNITMYHFQFK